MRSSLARNRRAISRIVAFATAVLLIVAAGGLGLLLYTAKVVDRAHVDEERALVSNYLREREHELVGQLISASIWDDAYLKLGRDFDAEWADLYVGSYFETYMRHAASLVLDEADRPIYAWRDGGRAGERQAAAFLHETAPLVAKVRELERLRGAARNRGMSGSITRTGVISVGAELYMVAVTNIVPETPAVHARGGAERLLISARRVDTALLQDVARDMRVADVRLLPWNGATPASVTLHGPNGRPIAALAWTSSHPSDAMLRQVAPVFALGLLALLGCTLALAACVRRVFGEIDRNDQALALTMDELVRARDEAAAASVAKSQFVANMSHEIRTPLNGILGMTQIMARDELSPAQRDRLDVVRESGQTLLTLLGDILDISKIEAGRLEIDNHEFDLAHAVHAACAPFAQLAGQKDVGFRIEIDEAAAGVWFGDGVRLRQVLANLASNAVKFTAAGEVAVRVARQTEGVRFTVRDTGIGIAADKMGDLFEKFIQVDASTTRRYGGTGLGLAISHELAAMMGGELTVESVEGHGSVFTALLPLVWRAPMLPPALPLPAAQSRIAKPGARAKILAAEDNLTNQLILRAMLEPFAIDLTIVGDGAQAVEAFFEGDYGLILMDVQMPVMNGVEATAAIRQLEAERELAATPILALSANVMNHQVAEYLAVGMNGFVPKPIEITRLLDAIDKVLDTTLAKDQLAA
ncbi:MULTISPECIES: ATP-binding protein [unclassified Phenylobacterium]|uniref:hybrid sensor histidine kinase/response regulator n=1 Tax=unclassified Phenylobacterium TaxID=2640670 RepID=UPI0009EBC656|nr:MULTISPECIES: ATP-binding protein [unclassified Phenylobacterium]